MVHIATGKEIYTINDFIEVNFEGLSGWPRDWITVVPKSLPDNRYHQWFYTGGQQSGTYKFRRLPPGDYEVRIFCNWPKCRYKVAQRTSFKVVEKLSEAPSPAKVELTFIQTRGKVKRTQSDEYVEITNNGGSPADLSGWWLNAGDRNQDFIFPDSVTLAPGQKIRVYTDEIHPEHGGFSFGIKHGIWNDKGGDIGLLHDADGEEISRLENDPAT